MRWFKDWLKCFVYEPKVVCYWDANDREIGHSDPMSIARNYDVGEARKAVVEAEAKANAVLMSAAPDILDALKRLVDRYDPEDAGFAFSPDPGCIECTHGVTPAEKQTGDCPMHSALKAIAKAEGRS
jgi:hypothetical protein